MIRQLTRALYPRESESDVERRAQETFSIHPFTTPGAQSELKDRLDALRLGEVGVMSVSEIYDSLLMWSYYGDSHQGFCVGFDVEKMEARFEQLAESDKILVWLNKVDYVQRYPNSNPVEMDDEEYVNTVLATKSIEWEREQEWRWILHGRTDYSVVLPPDCISKVIVGCLMSPQDVTALGRTLGFAGFRGKFLRAAKADFRFGLRMEQIDHGFW